MVGTKAILSPACRQAVTALRSSATVRTVGRVVWVIGSSGARRL